MKTFPRLLNYNSPNELQYQLFSDLQINKILSAQAISVLQKTCGKDEILRRQELFNSLLDNSENLQLLQNCLSLLLKTEHNLFLLKNTQIQLERYYRYSDTLSAYIDLCKSLAMLKNCGNIFSEVQNYFSSVEMRNLILQMSESNKKITDLLNKLHSGLLSFSDKNWLTSDNSATSEFDNISVCAQRLGFSGFEKKTLNIRINPSLSDAVCRLFSNEIYEIENLIKQFENVDFYEPLSYIPEIKFFLEIYDLAQKAEKVGLPHCIPTISEKPRYTAKALYDISLLSKQQDTIIPNDANFTEHEAFFFVIGANGGGKTTYLRTVGINLILFLAGCPVFAKEAIIYPFDFVISHFPKDERFDNVGRLDEELKRTEEILKLSGNKKSFLFFNETYSGTDDKRGFELLKNTAEQIDSSNHFGLYVTHFHEVMSIDYPILSAEIDCDDENRRTYKIVKSKGCASSYAADILKKYRLDKQSLETRRKEYGN